MFFFLHYFAVERDETFLCISNGGPPVLACYRDIFPSRFPEEIPKDAHSSVDRSLFPALSKLSPYTALLGARLPSRNRNPARERIFSMGISTKGYFLKKVLRKRDCPRRGEWDPARLSPGPRFANNVTLTRLTCLIYEVFHDDEKSLQPVLMIVFFPIS